MQQALLKRRLVLIALISTVVCQDIKIVYSIRDYIKELDVASGKVTMVAKVSDNVFSMAYDYKHGYLFLPRFNTGDILRLNYPRGSLTTIVPVTVQPADVAIDPIYEHLYWTEKIQGGRIVRCNLDGSNVITITSEEYPWAITLDLQNRWIYYSVHGPIGNIKRVRLNGTNKQYIIGHTNSIVGLNIDNEENRLYYLNFNTGDIQSIITDGSSTISIHIITSGNYDLDIHDENIYCTNNNQILMLLKHSGTTKKLLHTEKDTVYSVLVHVPNGKYCYEDKFTKFKVYICVCIILSFLYLTR